jgi:hypothetical protein
VRLGFRCQRKEAQGRHSTAITLGTGVTPENSRQTPDSIRNLKSRRPDLACDLGKAPAGRFDSSSIVLDSSRTLKYPHSRGQDGNSRQNRMCYRGRVKMDRSFKYLILISFIPTILFGQSETNKIRVLIVDGFSNHDWKQTTLVVKTIVVGSSPTRVTSPSHQN